MTHISKCLHFQSHFHVLYHQKIVYIYFYHIYPYKTVYFIYMDTCSFYLTTLLKQQTGSYHWYRSQKPHRFPHKNRRKGWVVEDRLPEKNEKWRWVNPSSQIDAPPVLAPVFYRADCSSISSNLCGFGTQGSLIPYCFKIV